MAGGPAGGEPVIQPRLHTLTLTAARHPRRGAGSGCEAHIIVRGPSRSSARPCRGAASSSRRRPPFACMVFLTLYARRTRLRPCRGLSPVSRSLLAPARHSDSRECGQDSRSGQWAYRSSKKAGEGSCSGLRRNRPPRRGLARQPAGAVPSETGARIPDSMIEKAIRSCAWPSLARRTRSRTSLHALIDSPAVQ
jgi:hypothetical protein